MIETLIDILCRERGEKPPKGMNPQQAADYFRALCNIRPPGPLSRKFLGLQDRYLSQKSRERGVVDAAGLDYKDGIALWQGDITRLDCDAIVNACNAALLGCFHPLHNCIDNVIHTNAGVQVRQDCHRIMQGNQLPNGEVRVTSAYNLPSQYIFHTVGPIIERGRPSGQDEADLAKCYISCIEKAFEMGLETLALCCLSTGVYGYPKALAAELAVRTVRERLSEINEIKGSGRGHVELKVIFTVFTDEDKRYYERELSRKAQ